MAPGAGSRAGSSGSTVGGGEVGFSVGSTGLANPGRYVVSRSAGRERECPSSTPWEILAAYNRGRTTPDTGVSVSWFVSQVFMGMTLSPLWLRRQQRCEETAASLLWRLWHKFPVAPGILTVTVSTCCKT